MTMHRVMDLEGDLLDAAVMLAGVTRSPSPSRDPTIAWSLMELHGIDVFHTRGGGVQASVGDQEWVTEGPTQLVAVMRAFVRFRLGEEVDLPGPQ